MNNAPRIGVDYEPLSQRHKDMDGVRTVSPATGYPQVTLTRSATIAALGLVLSVVDQFKEES
jgi:hypothetical protein